MSPLIQEVDSFDSPFFCFFQLGLGISISMPFDYVLFMLLLIGLEVSESLHSLFKTPCGLLQLQGCKAPKLRFERL